MEIICTTNPITLLLSKNWIYSIQSSSCNYWCNLMCLSRKTFRRIRSWEGSATSTKLWILIYVDDLPIFFLNVKLVTIFEMEGNLSLITELKVLKIQFSHIATIEAWYSLDPTIINFKSLENFKSKLLAFIWQVQRSMYSVFHVHKSFTLGTKSLKRTKI